MKIKFTWKIWLWIIVLAFSLIAIFYNPNYFMQKGVLITNIEQNSSAFEQGLRQGQIITAIDGKIISNVEDFSNAVKDKFTSTEKVKTIITTKDSEYVLYSNESLNLIISKLPSSNIKTGLDLSGGARALIKAENHDLTSSEITDLVNVVSNRLNVYGISDMTIRPVSDLAGNNYILIEIAGATPKDLESLVSQQGKFEAKIGNETIFMGGKQDITSVSRSGQDSGVYSCAQAAQGFFCEFRFVVYLSEQAAEKHATITDELEVNSTSQGNYLSKKLDLYLDDNLVDSLLISEGLKGRVTTQIQVSGSGTGETKAEAYDNAVVQMNKLQTVLITGSLPFKLEIVKLDTISPTLGENFSKYIFYAGIAALLLVGIIIFIKYKKFKLVIPSFLICTSELIITLGIASIIGQDLDLPGIAGILAAIGTGIDDQIVMLDEVENKEIITIKQKIKKAFGIILGAYLTVLVSLLPLLWAGAGLLRGFAIITIIGITSGVLITRPAFADLVKIISDKN